jgi:hypothetical protein
MTATSRLLAHFAQGLRELLPHQYRTSAELLQSGVAVNPRDSALRAWLWSDAASAYCRLLIRKSRRLWAPTPVKLRNMASSPGLRGNESEPMIMSSPGLRPISFYARPTACKSGAPCHVPLSCPKYVFQFALADMWSQSVFASKCDPDLLPAQLGFNRHRYLKPLIRLGAKHYPTVTLYQSSPRILVRLPAIQAHILPILRQLELRH